jgi:thiamine-monophosphate kinase
VRVSELGEFGLIKLLAKELGVDYPPSRVSIRQAGLILGLGDDALVTERQDAALVWTTDTLVAGVHFLPERTAWTDTGWKALAVNVSDIAAMGASPHLALVTLMLPSDACVDGVLDFYRGLIECAKAFGVTVGGGDIVRAPVFAATVALAGWASESRLSGPRIMTRNAARPGDVVAVSGTPGDSAGGLRLLRAERATTTAAEQRLRAAHERPEPRVALGKAAVDAGVRCAIDVSDGLAQDLGHVATASEVSIRIEASRVPVSAELRATFPADALLLALAGGEDYELVLVAPRQVMDALIAKQAAAMLLGGEYTPLKEIGAVIETVNPCVAVVDETGREIEVGPGGWDHFGS